MHWLLPVVAVLGGVALFSQLPIEYRAYSGGVSVLIGLVVGILVHYQLAAYEPWDPRVEPLPDARMPERDRR